MILSYFLSTILTAVKYINCINIEIISTTYAQNERQEKAHCGLSIIDCRENMNGYIYKSLFNVYKMLSISYEIVM